LQSRPKRFSNPGKLNNPAEQYMTTINLDDTLINEVITIGHYQNAEEAVVKILADYVRQKKQATIADLLAK